MKMKRTVLAATVLTVAAGILVTAAFIGCGDMRSGQWVFVPEYDAACAPAMAMTAESESRDDMLQPEHNTESYDHIVDNAFVRVADRPLSTFSVDVDTASYANVRRFLNDGRLPPPGAVRIEEMVNYFSYAYTPPESGKAPFAVHVAAASCPWQAGHRLVRIALKGREIKRDKRPLSNLVFLLDVSGSMGRPNKLPLLKSAMRLLVEQLGENDRVAIVVYASSEGLALPSTPCDRKERVLSALDSLSAGGSTAGGRGIELAYTVAQKNFIKGGVNRVILATDGDFNVGVTDNSQLVRLIQAKARSGVFLSVLGFGTGNYKDSRMEKLADEGNGNYAYIDTLKEARKVLVEQMRHAGDHRQGRQDPGRVQSRQGGGLSPDRLREPHASQGGLQRRRQGRRRHWGGAYRHGPVPGRPGRAGGGRAAVDPLRYQQSTAAPVVAAGAAGDEMLTVKLRYKQPDGERSARMDYPVKDVAGAFDRADNDFKFAAAVASFGMILRDSKHKGTYTLAGVAEIAGAATGDDRKGYRAEFIKLVERARELKDR